MDHKTVDVSIITPFYKGNAFMEQLFGCIRRNAQTAPNLSIELVLVNDSPEFEILYNEDWVDGFALKIYRNPVNMGIHSSRINGLLQASGAFIIFLDQDDLLADMALASQYQLSQNADIVVSNGVNENRDRKKPIYHSLAHQARVKELRFYMSVGCMIVSPGQCLIRRTAIPQLWIEKRIGCNGADDYFLWLLLLQDHYRWQINPDVLYTHIDTGENLSIDLNRMLRSSVEVLDILKQEGLLTPTQEKVAKRRFAMRQLYEGRKRWRIGIACIRYPDLFLELLYYTYLKKLCA